MLIAEEFLLLSLDDERGVRSIGTDRLDPALGAAVLVELALMERIGVTGREAGWGKRGRVTITSTKPTDDPVLDQALSYLVEREGKKVTDLISPMTRRPMTKGLRDQLLSRLGAAGILTERDKRALGVFPMTVWPTADPTAELAVRQRLRSALVDGLTPTERTAALVALLHAVDRVHKVLPDEDKRLVRRRAKELAEGDWAGKALADVIAAIQTGVVAAASGGGGDGGS